MGSARTYSMVMFAVCIAVLAAQLQQRVRIPEHLRHHKAMYEEGLLTEAERSELVGMMREMRDFPTNSQDVRFYTAVHEHIGEGVPVGPDGKCEHPFLVPDNAHKMCVLAGRIDVGRHYIKHGGVVGLKERYEQAISRLLSFGRYQFDPSEQPTIQRLFDSPKFQAAAKSVCPAESQYLDPFQYNFIVQIPGQTVALHIDAPYFWGASRFQYPQWLLAAMVYSGKFKELFIDQVQVVAYLHAWEDVEGARDGDFVYWTDETRNPERAPPHPRAGSMVDGSKVVHAAMVYQPGVLPPVMDKSVDNKLTLVGDAATSRTWALMANGTLLREYPEDDLRISLVYRARCFKDKAEADKYNAEKDSNVIPLDTILRTLGEGLVERGVAKSVDELMDMPRLDYALLLLDNYISYPLPPKAMVPFNYCALPRLAPWTSYLLAPFC